MPLWRTPDCTNLPFIRQRRVRLIPDDEVRGTFFGTLLRGYRSASGLTQEDLAERSGVSIRAIADMERGRTARPFRHSVHRLAEALELREAERDQLERASRSATAEILLAAGQDGLGATGELRLCVRQPEAGNGQSPRQENGQGPGRENGQGPGRENGQGARQANGHGGDQERPPRRGTVSRGETVPRRGTVPGQATVPRQLPWSAADFVGRSAELRALSGVLAQRTPFGGTAQILAIVGAAGVGKTALAVRGAHQVADQFPDGQLYVDLRGFDPSAEPAEPADVIRGFLHALGQPSARVPVAGQAAVQAAAGQYRSLLTGRRMLIVLDNARDPQQVRPLLPGDPACTVVVTSRNQLTGLVVADGACPLFLDVLTRAEASELLARRLGAQRLAGEPQAAEELIGLSGRLPLALAAMAARAAANPGLTLRDLAADLRDGSRRLDALETGEPATSLRAMLTSSDRLLTRPAARMLRLLGRRSGPEFSAAAAAALAGITVGQARTLLRELVRFSLVTEHPADRFAFRAFVRSYAAERALAASSE
jgi:transcriptional regulator with XRE-family HTH domain